MVKKSGAYIIKITFLAVIASASGWMVWQGVRDLFHLETLSPIASIGLGLFVAWFMFKIGLRK